MPKILSPDQVEHEKKYFRAQDTATVHGWMGTDQKIRLSVVIKICRPHLGPSGAARLRDPDPPRVALVIPALETQGVSVFRNYGCEAEVD